MDTEDELRRLQWQCRRGLLELDILFERFLLRHYAELDADERHAFRSLLQQPDSLVLAWLQGQEIPPDHLRKIIKIVTQ